MRTVWHWKNIGKGLLTLLGVTLASSIIVTILGIDETYGGVLGLLIGFGTYVWCSMYWDFYHFE